MHQKRVTSELHDSYSRLMTIKHSISKIQWVIVWVLNYYLTQLSLSPRSSCQEGSRQLETRCGRESHTRPRGASGTPMEWTPASGEQERHNMAVITVGSRYYSLCSVSSSLSHATLEQPFRTYINLVPKNQTYHHDMVTDWVSTETNRENPRPPENKKRRKKNKK